MKTLIKRRAFLTMDNDYSEYDCADILVDGTKIAALGPNLFIHQDEV